MRRRGLCVICHVGPGQLNPSAPLFSRAVQPLPAFPAIGNGPCRIGPASDGAASAELPAACTHGTHGTLSVFCPVVDKYSTDLSPGPPAPVWPHPINAGPKLGPVRYLHLEVPPPRPSMPAAQQPSYTNPLLEIEIFDSAATHTLNKIQPLLPLLPQVEASNHYFDG